MLVQRESKNEAADSFLRQLDEDMGQAIQNLTRTQDRQKKYADQRRRDMELQVGDEFLLSMRNLQFVVTAGGIQKLGTLYCGPFKVMEKLIGGYKLDLPPNMKIHLVFHVSQLKLYRKPEDRRRKYSEPEPIVTPEGIKEYEVEEIVNHRKRRRGELQKWNT